LHHGVIEASTGLATHNDTAEVGGDAELPNMWCMPTIARRRHDRTIGDKLKGSGSI
jgi:hypothetical protein